MDSSTSGRYGFYYHLVGPQGLINDPNGLAYFKGYYHVFFQWNPSGTTHANKHWGHLRSKDLLTWERLPLALAPDQWYDKNGVYSGSALVYHDQLYLFYTGNVKDQEGNATSYQCLAISQDGIHFEKKGPLFPHPAGYTRHVRDPKVWYDQRVGHYWMVLGAQKDSLIGDCLVYKSGNLEDWTLVGSLLPEDFQLGYMWECPDIIVFDNQERMGSPLDAFIYSPQGMEQEGDAFANRYQTLVHLGKFSSKGYFKPQALDLVEVDAGFDYYAPQSFQAPDGRILQWGWMGQPEGAEATMPTHQEGWLHALTLPRQLTIEEGSLRQRPAKELQALRQNEQALTWTQATFQTTLDSPQQEFLIEWQEGLKGDMTLDLRDSLRLEYQADQQRLVLTRTNWETGLSESRARVLTQPLFKLQGFLEASSLEIFVNDGREVFSSRYFNPDASDDFFYKAQVPAPMKLSFYTMPGKSFIQDREEKSSQLS